MRNILKQSLLLEQDPQFLNNLLSQHTLCGTVTGDGKSLLWHCLISHDLRQSICKDPFEAKALIDKHTHLTFMKIKSLGVLNSQDQVSRVVENAGQSVASCQSQMADGKFGNARLCFVRSDNQEVVGGCDLLTLEDMIFKLM